MNWNEVNKRLIYHKVIAKPFDRYFLPVSIGLIATILSLMEQNRLSSILCVSITILWLTCQMWIQNARKKAFAENDLIKISEEGLSVETDSFKGVFKWEYYDKVVEDHDVFMFFKKVTLFH